MTITTDAATELRNRATRYGGGDAVLIVGPLDGGYPMAESEEEARHLEIAYGPPRRWRLRMLSLHEFVRLRDHVGKSVHALDLDGIPALVVTAVSDVKLRVDLDGEGIRIDDEP